MSKLKALNPGQAFLIGFLAVLVLLELGLRIIGIWYHSRLKVPPDAAGSGQYTILCLGDSFTFGIGAAPEQSYPRQLQDLLNRGLPVKRFQVVNQGVVGQSTGLLLKNLEHNLSRFKPNMIVVMSGLNNSWNYAGYNNYERPRGWWPVMRDKLAEIKIYQLARLLARDIRAKKDRNAAAPSVHPGSGDKDYAALAAASCQNRNYAQALQWYRQALVAEPGRAAEIVPKVLALFDQLHDYDGAFTFFNQAVALNPKLADALRYFQQRKGINLDIEKWIKGDLQHIISLCRELNLTVILMDYPRGLTLGAGLPSGVIRDTAAALNVPYVDNAAVFNSLPQSRRYFIADGHCNGAGYAIVARNAAKVIQPLLP